MKSGPYLRHPRTHWVVIAAVLTFVFAAYLAYGVNMVLWKDATDYGWRAMYDSGPNVVDEVFGRGWQAGLRPGDTIQSINDISYESNGLFRLVGPRSAQ